MTSTQASERRRKPTPKWAELIRYQCGPQDPHTTDEPYCYSWNQSTPEPLRRRQPAATRCTARRLGTSMKQSATAYVQYYIHNAATARI